MDKTCERLENRWTHTLVIHEAPAELLEGSPVAHGPERAVELVVGHHQVLRVTSHVDHLELNHDNIVLYNTDAKCIKM